MLVDQHCKVASSVDNEMINNWTHLLLQVIVGLMINLIAFRSSSTRLAFIALMSTQRLRR